VPGVLQAVEFVMKDSKRFPDTNGWGYRGFRYYVASGTFTPYGNASTGKAFCHQCHTVAPQKDFVFAAYTRR
jgi:hypothetical protein